MTPEQWTAVLGGVALILSSLGGLAAAIISGISMRRNAKTRVTVEQIKTATDGAATASAEAKRALEAKVEALEARLVEALAAKLEAALAARQAATDVRSAGAGRAYADGENDR